MSNQPEFTKSNVTGRAIRVAEKPGTRNLKPNDERESTFFIRITATGKR